MTDGMPCSRTTATPSDWDVRLRAGGQNAFDAVRLLLATLVLLEHSYFLVEGTWTHDPLSMLSGGRTNCGYVAVVMFFSISGFLVSKSLVESESIRQYLIKRIARIVPGFYLASAVGLLVIGPMVAPDAFAYFQMQNWRGVAVAALFMKQTAVVNVLAGNPIGLVHGTLWTIKYEFDCYLLLGLLAWAGMLGRNSRAGGFLLIASVLVAVTVFRPPVINYGIGGLIISSPDRWPDLFPFFFSGSAFYFYRQRIPKSRRLLVACIVGLVASLRVGGVYWILLFAGTYVVLYTALSTAAEVRIGNRRVDLSYGVYLYGWPIQQLLLFYSGTRPRPLELFCIALAISYATAWLSWVFVEHPCLALVRRTGGAARVVTFAPPRG